MITSNSVGTQINDILGKYGLPGGMLGAQVDTLLGNPLGALGNLRDGFQEAARGRGTNKFERLTGGRLPHAHPGCPSSLFKQNSRLCGAGYHGGRQRIDLAAGTPNNFLSRIFNPRRRGAAKFEALLKKSPFARAAFERAVGGRITSFGKSDGKMTIQRSPFGRFPSPIGMSPFAAPAMGILPGMSQSILGQAGRLGLGAAAGGLLTGSPFGAFAGAGLASVLGNPLGMGGALGGGNYGSWNPMASPGSIANSNPMAERAHTAQNQSMLNDPSLTVEDAIMLMLMNIMKKMDKDIKKQAQKISSMNNQQGNSKAGGQGKSGSGKGNMLGKAGKAAGTALGGKVGGKVGNGIGSKLGGAGAAGGQNGQQKQNSIDIETQKLSQLTKKRGNMFQTLQKIMEGYNSTAKGTIQSMNR
jgi:hypothetical protein